MPHYITPARCLLAIAMVGAAHLPAWGQSAAFTPNGTFLHQHISYVVQADGRFTLDKSQDVLINTDQGVKQLAQMSAPYSATLQELQVLEAYTLTADGKRIDVKADAIHEQQSPASAGAPMFDDVKVKNVVFPAVQIGSRLVMRTRLIQKTPLFSGHFFTIEAAWPTFDYKSFKVSVTAPASLKLQVLANKMQGGVPKSDAAHQQVWQWTQENLAASPPEQGAVSAHEHIPLVAMSSFGNYDAVAKAYLAGAQAKATVTPGLQKLADDITQGATDQRQQAELIYRWVNHNIRYVAIFLGFGGVVPHDAQAIADARYGDCKDKTTLLQALLAAKGIKSSTALVNATDVYWLPAIANPAAFNHAITYIPQFNLFVDSTPGKGMFGTLSPQLYGKPALVIQNASGVPEMMKIPMGSPAEHGVNIQTTLMLSKDGQVTGQSQIESRGYPDLMARLIMTSFPPGVEPQVAAQLLAMTGQNGSGTLIHKGAEDTAKPFSYSTTFKLPDFAQLPGPGALVIPPGLNGFINIASALAPMKLEQRSLPMILINGQITEQITFKLPAELSPSRLPAPTTVDTPFGRYAAHYEMQGRDLVLKRELTIQRSDPVLQVADYTKARALHTAVMRNLSTQILY